MSIKSSKYFCFVAFHVLEAHLAGQKPDPKIVNEIPDVELPLFVTYHINGDELRGCIGNLQGLNIRQGIPQYAIIAAIKDHRFSPITAKELNKLNVAVSLLIDYEEAANALDWEVGKHGIIIDYRGSSAVFLPEVAAEQEWDQKQTLQQLLKKAGVYQKYSDEMLKEIKCTRYQSSKEVLTWDEYIKMKEGK